ncbi:hypothetical protein [Dictyobacter formicarum]|uniref:Response regulatory domain-containing protein n=1 Tax=Dictyobacter formicarum TaxID=2778368 RepID=A0ABQ3VVA7_9CHLR|nr:hypothetical protein [Dictyobacter formicarum]GHO89827.1 hypothetical protein KSZ_78330 [Dictyobacter formicarum]
MSSVDSIKELLVIDDNPPIVELINIAVNLHGRYQVVGAYTEVSVAERVSAEHLTCEFLVCKMPEMMGYQ